MYEIRSFSLQNILLDTLKMSNGRLSRVSNAKISETDGRGKMADSSRKTDKNIF